MFKYQFIPAQVGEITQIPNPGKVLVIIWGHYKQCSLKKEKKAMWQHRVIYRALQFNPDMLFLANYPENITE